ncbi:MAG: TetR/AcrR family transcriptional regulator [Oscillospiraceae bacterium]|nr:TetR/AcrR family transcriptional regulator [Oscillospiraceae bacterium]
MGNAGTGRIREHRNRNVQQKIYDCAIDLFIEKGFENVKISDICKAAQVSTGTFYYYYPSKESIFFNYANAIDDLVESEFPKLKAATCEETLRNLIMFKFNASIQAGPAVNNVSWTAELKHNKDVAMDLRRVAYGYYMNTIEAGIRNGEFRQDINLYSATSLIRYAIGGLILHWSIQGEEMDVNSEAERIVDLIITLLKPPRE